jgi:tetratricopeptide (TPR) repeat protein
MWEEYRYLVLRCAGALRSDGFPDLCGELSNKIASGKRSRKSAMLYVAEFSWQAGELQIAQQLFSRLLRAARDEYRYTAAALGGLGNIAMQTGNFRDAERFFRERQTVSRAAGDSLEWAKSTACLGQIAFSNREYGKAVRRFTEAKTVFSRYAYRNGEQAALGNLGNARYRLGQTDKASRLFARQERICRETGNLSALLSALDGQFLTCLPHIENGAGSYYERAAKILDAQEVLYEETRAPEKRMYALCNRAALESRARNNAEALSLLTQAYELACRLNHFEGQNTLLTNLADYFFAANDLDQAIDFAGKRVALCRKRKHPPSLCNALFRLSYFYRAQNRDRESLLAESEARQIIAYHNVTPDALTDDILLIQKGEKK